MATDNCLCFRCECSQCEVMATEQECKSCTEIQEVRDKMEEVEDPEERGTCITEHPGFPAVCLNVWVLQTAYHAYVQRYNPVVGPDVE